MAIFTLLDMEKFPARPGRSWVGEMLPVGQLMTDWKIAHARSPCEEIRPG